MKKICASGATLVILWLGITLALAADKTPPGDLAAWGEIIKRYHGHPCVIAPSVPRPGFIAFFIYEKKYLDEGGEPNIPSNAEPIAMDVRVIVPGLPIALSPPVLFLELRNGEPEIVWREEDDLETFPADPTPAEADKDLKI
ncbi:MAG: hypothetical protein ABIC19_02785 [Patescibacteria group bacterium]